MKEITFEQVKQGVTNWHSIAQNTTLVDYLYQHPLRFEIASTVYDKLEQEKYVKLYFGYKETTIDEKKPLADIVRQFFLVVIPDSLDKEENYKGDQLPEHVFCFSAVPYGPIGSDEISSKEAEKRRGSWENAKRRKRTLKKFKSAPLIFQIPRTNLTAASNINHLYFGLVNKNILMRDFQYDLIVEQLSEGNEKQGNAFFDTARPVPPFQPTIMDHGLYSYLKLELN